MSDRQEQGDSPRLLTRFRHSFGPLLEQTPLSPSEIVPHLSGWLIDRSFLFLSFPSFLFIDGAIPLDFLHFFFFFY